ncbi:hypothetical protein [Coleofasciculus sp. H7-2]|uniref:hypothetical protein n=1 Tax=Coleofasciculus sp. H7-2 TaxID=3351545 RepID=UPI00366D8228
MESIAGMRSLPASVADFSPKLKFGLKARNPFKLTSCTYRINPPGVQTPQLIAQVHQTWTGEELQSIEMDLSY